MVIIKPSNPLMTYYRPGREPRRFSVKEAITFRLETFLMAESRKNRRPSRQLVPIVWIRSEVSHFSSEVHQTGK